jgi:uncharacterized protein YeaO (DUF488 family)
MIRVRRALELAKSKDEPRIVVDRLRSCGIGKKAVRIDSWYKGVAPGKEIRKRLNHDPARCGEFGRCYFDEPDNNPTAWSSLV